jgi:hypothetical protein
MQARGTPQCLRKRYAVNLENVSTKNLNDIEQLLVALQLAMHKAGIKGEPISASLQEFKNELEKVRRARFDAANPEFSGY